MPSDADPRSGRGLEVREGCTSRTAGHEPHRTNILLCHTGTLAEWRTVQVMGVVDGVVTVAADEELQRFRNHAPEALARAVAEAGPEAHLNTRFGYLFLASWPRDAEAVFSLVPADRPQLSCG
jgi:hypothetical protein